MLNLKEKENFTLSERICKLSVTSFPEYSGGRVKCIAVKGEIASARFRSVARCAQYHIFLFRERSDLRHSCQSLSEVEGTREE